MAKLDERLSQAVKDSEVPHAVVFATNGEGNFTCKHAVGKHVLGESTPIAEDAVFSLASSTKILTSIATLQIVEKDLFGLDDDVASKLPELAEQPILKGFDESDKPILEERKNPITLRHLLTHAAGCAYDAGDANLMKFAEANSRTPNTGGTIAERFTYPLIFEPGTQWMYSTGVDWAGRLIERVTDQTLGEYFEQNIFRPLEVENITFFADRNEQLKDRIPGLTVRTPDGKLLRRARRLRTMGDFLKVLRSILANDDKLLKPETVEMMFTPQLSPETKASLAYFRRNSPLAAMFIGENDAEVEADWGIGGILFMQDDVGRRKKGTLNWGGASNTFWIIDREADLALAFGTQVFPPGDGPSSQVIKEVELGVYEMAGVNF